MKKAISEAVKSYRESSGFNRRAQVVEPHPDADMAGVFVLIRSLAPDEWQEIEKSRREDNSQGAQDIALRAVLLKSPENIFDELPAFADVVATQVVRFSGFTGDPLVSKAP